MRSLTQAAALELWGYTQCDSLRQLRQCRSPSLISHLCIWRAVWSAGLFPPDYSKANVQRARVNSSRCDGGSPHVWLSGELRERVREEEEAESWASIILPRSSSSLCCFKTQGSMMEAPPNVLPLQQLPWSPARTPSLLWKAALTGGDVTDSTYEQHVCHYKQMHSSSQLHLSSLQRFPLHLWWHCPRPLRLPRRLSPPPHKSPLWEISAGDGEAVGTPLWAQTYYRLCLLWVLWTATSILSHTATRGEGGEAWWCICPHVLIRLYLYLICCVYCEYLYSSEIQSKELRSDTSPQI